MPEPLAVYLHDHLAGSRLAIELLDSLCGNYPDHDTGRLAAEVLKEIFEDRAVLEHLIERVGSGRPDLKDAAAWLAEKASRAKLQQDRPTGLGVYEAFEALKLGIQGKLALWQALDAIAAQDSRLAGVNYRDLAARAQSQYERVDGYWRQLVPTALLSNTA